MNCDLWTADLDAYADGELMQRDVQEFEAHLRGCAACAAAVVERQALKRAVRVAGRRYTPSAELRARVRVQLHEAGGERRRWAIGWRWAAVAAAVVLAVAGGALWRRQTEQGSLVREVVDLHVANLASATPVEVVSSDRHTVKPWFQGKLPFTFNLPDLAGTDFRLIGGRMAYLDGAPAAHLVFQVRQHYLSAFLVQERGVRLSGVRRSTEANFHVETWSAGGLRYIVISDAAPEDVAGLSDLLRKAALQ